MDIKVRVYKRHITESQHFFDIMQAGISDVYARCWLNDYELKPFKFPYNDDFVYVSRLIWEGEDIVVKLDDSYNQVSTEIDLWENVIETKDRRYFATLLDHGVSQDRFEVPWVAMQKYDLFNPFDEDEPETPVTRFDDKIKKLIKKYKLCDVGEECGSNWGIDIKEDRPIIYDYGSVGIR
jgi:hypothetical protein